MKVLSVMWGAKVLGECCVPHPRPPNPAQRKCCVPHSSLPHVVVLAERKWCVPHPPRKPALKCCVPTRIRTPSEPRPAEVLCPLRAPPRNPKVLCPLQRKWCVPHGHSIRDAPYKKKCSAPARIGIRNPNTIGGVPTRIPPSPPQSAVSLAKTTQRLNEIAVSPRESCPHANPPASAVIPKVMCPLRAVIACGR